MRGLLTLAKLFDAPPRYIGQLAGWLLLPLIMVIMFDVITRKIDWIRIWIAEANIYWFNPIIFQDAQWHLHGMILLSTFGFGYLYNSHVRVDVLRETLQRRTQAWIEFWGLLLMGIPFLITITYFALQFVMLSYSQNEGSESLTGIGARYIIKSFLIIGFALLLSAFIATILRLWVALMGSPEDQALAYASLDIFPSQALSEEIAEIKTDLAEPKDGN
ncbi:MAG: TRAP transporter small permease subunit [Hyphomicrobiaceae bacterium]